MTQSQLFARPHRLLLARFFSQGLVAAVIVTLILSIVLSWLNRNDHIGHVSETVRERVARVAERVSNAMQSMPPEMMSGSMQDGPMTLQDLVVQEIKIGKIISLEVTNENGVIIAAQDEALIGEKSHIPEVAQASELGQPVSRIVDMEVPYLRFASPITVNGEQYVVLVDEPLTGLESMIRESRLVVNLILSFGFGITFLVLSLIVRRAGLDIENHQQEEMRVKDLLGRYVSHQVAKQILDQGGLNVGGERRQITIIFADIRGFTTVAEQLSPERVVTLLNDYLAAMTDVVFKYDGTVDKFLGDGLMALFGAPLGHGDDVRRALACAKEMQTAFNQLRQKWRAEGLPDLQQGIGINTGEAVVGSIGSARRLDYTAIGDAVNTAQRLQSLAVGGQILISASTLSRLDDEPAEPLGPLKVKGKREAVNVFRLVLD
jgi:class 3 adenylate cyclase